jgi:hypothetical protein
VKVAGMHSKTDPITSLRFKNIVIALTDMWNNEAHLLGDKLPGNVWVTVGDTGGGWGGIAWTLPQALRLLANNLEGCGEDGSGVNEEDYLAAHQDEDTPMIRRTPTEIELNKLAKALGYGNAGAPDTISELGTETFALDMLTACQKANRAIKSSRGLHIDALTVIADTLDALISEGAQ